MSKNQENKSISKLFNFAVQKFKSNIDYFYLLVGVFFYGLIAFRWHMPLATWIAPIFLIKFFRSQEKIKTTLIALPLLAISSYLKMRGGWDISVVFQIAACIFLPVLIMLPLYLDRYLYRKYNSGWITLAYPALVIVIEFILGLTLIGAVFSLGVTQIEHTVIIQVSALIGAWGVSFLIAWTAVTINQVWDTSFNFRKPSKSVKIFAIIFLVNILFGASRLAITPPDSPTVRIGSISVEHRGDYWGEIIDNNTPPESVATYSQEFQEIEDELFLQSVKAVAAGSEVIFWSEGNCVYFEDQE